MSASVSLVVPTYNMARYLPEFLASLDGQLGGLEAVELVFVDDGSTDRSAELIEAWIARHPGEAARLLRKPNGGLSSARNAGLAAATGTWVSFPDPDDVLTPGYLAAVREFLGSPEATEVDLAATNLVLLHDTGEIEDAHPLRFKFGKGRRVVDLDRNPTYIHLHANTGFYRRERLAEHGLMFSTEIFPTFEDAHLTGLYLSRADPPKVAMLGDAVYHYRRPADGSSLVQAGWTKAGKYLNVPRHGWLHLLADTHARLGRVPLWMQNLVLYDVFYYLRADRKLDSPTGALPSEWTEAFHESLTEVMRFIDAESISDYAVRGVRQEARRALLLGPKGAQARPPVAFLSELDADRGLVRLQYFFSGSAPVEQIRARGWAVDPVHAKTRAVRYFGRTTNCERTLWLPADGTLALSLDGRRVPLVVGPPRFDRYSVGPTAIWSGLANRPPPKAAERRAGEPPATLRAKVGRVRRDAAELAERARQWGRGLRTQVAGASFAGAWLLMDRDNQAQDNAEHLYRYLRREQPQVDAYFVLDRGSVDWARLEAEGFRLIAFRSPEHAQALGQCAHLIASQIDEYVLDPFGTGRDEATWRFTYLRHGVNQLDQSIWLNRKPIALMASTTAAERAAIISDGSPYVFSDREVRLTGLARHDRLLALGAERTEPPTTVLVAPTWRRTLVGDRVSGGNERGSVATFWQSPYALAWRSFLTSERLRAGVDKLGWRVLFVPHPNMQQYVESADLPDHVQIARFGQIDIQQVLAGSGVLVTDYSSLAFDLAYLGRPAVYFQFDRADFLDGNPALRRDAWDYDEHGFGPVHSDVDAAVEATLNYAAAGGTPDEPYARRIAETFAYRDGQCCRRIYEAVLDLSRPRTYDELYLRRDAVAEPARG